MNESHELPPMRDFVMSLLLVAAGDGRSKQEVPDIVANAALRHSLTLCADLPELLKRAAFDARSLGGWLSGDRPIGSFFEFCGSLLDALDQRLRGRHHRLPSQPDDEPSAYDHAAFLALGQTLCHAASVRGGRFPPLIEGLRRASSMSPIEMQQALVANYLGNLLQDYFEATQVRAEFPTLPADIENTLRYEEATALAECIFRAERSSPEALEVSVIQLRLRELIGRVRSAEKALDD